ncbi:MULTISPECIES: hypothetical protein [unclassified Gilliamella]|uniref:hypothetical protein n=1 Tax=unclassified Gilliamella TaxID=2685620 RepID=UPI00130B4648|nr:MULTISPECIES: hypothetical protein [unclassified Gilliamella]MWP50404.1 hypothetical protein [Gilliamella sp. Lep-s35]MWP70125.1 hypothetical protein [Gilliamella sp. Lep-s5]MWP78350.1 hypothetical protein [Gilliamella sp. Lep-s21]
MLKQNIKNYLDEEYGTVLPDYQEKFKNALLKYHINPNSAFFEFVSKYSDEYYGKYGLLYDIAADLSTDDNVTQILHEKEQVPLKYISLINLETEDYLLYNKENEHVVLIEGGNIDKLKNNNFDKEWNSFNEFLEDFFELN